MDIVMPSLGADMEEGTLTQWQVRAGDTVTAGDIIAVIETNKGAIDMEVFESGVISELCLEPVVTVPVGTVMATMVPTHDSAEDNVPSAQTTNNAAPSVQTTDHAAPPAQAPEDDAPAAQHEDGPEPNLKFVGARVVASPAARLLAQREHLSLSAVTGSGPHGAVLLRDLYLAESRRSAHGELATGLAAEAASAKPALKPNAPDDDNKMRRSIALIMEKSKREIPHYYLTQEIDISVAKKFLDTINAEREPEQRLLLLALMLRAIAMVLPQHPQLNGYYQHDRFEHKKNIHIGNAITLRGAGLVVPAIHNVESLSLDQTMAALRDVIARSRSGHLRSSELSNATITVSNIGDRGADAVFAVIYPPQVAIIGLGKPQQKARVIDGNIKACFSITVSLSADHRVSDGVTGAKFLNALDNQLQHPEIL